MTNFLSASGALKLMIKADWTEPRPHVQTGEERLCEAVLLSAIDDYLHPVRCGYKFKTSRLKEEAHEWFTRPITVPDAFSFAGICETLNLDKQAVWKRVQKLGLMVVQESTGDERECGKSQV